MNYIGYLLITIMPPWWFLWSAHALGENRYSYYTIIQILKQATNYLFVAKLNIQGFVVMHLLASIVN